MGAEGDGDDGWVSACPWLQRACMRRRQAVTARFAATSRQQEASPLLKMGAVAAPRRLVDDDGDDAALQASGATT